MTDGRWDVLARPVTGGKPGGKIVTVAGTPGNNIFPDAKTDRRGRVWVTWQSFAGARSDVFARYYDAKSKTWSKTIRVTRHAAGDWEPRLAFGSADEALIVFDSYRGGDFSVYLARVGLEGQVRIAPVVKSAHYEARAAAAASPDGKTLWVAYEEGTKRWGKDLGSEWRRYGGGLNYDRRMRMVKVDLATGDVSPLPDVTSLIPGLSPAKGPNSPAVNLPEVAVDRQGRAWLFLRYYSRANWRIAVTMYDPAKAAWTLPRMLAKSTYCQDRRLAAALGPKGGIYAVWPSDSRRGKQQGDSGIHVVRIDPSRPRKAAAAGKAAPRWTAPAPVNETPERPRGDRHTWKFAAQEYALYWGDLHRHTDFSNCRTPDDGCIVEHFRYAYDAAGLDYLATTDHTDAGKVYHPYEWWQSQKLADMFQNPGMFLSFYAYEREQRWPYGHRNVVFIKRGGPIVYIKRANYAKSRWATPLPAQDGARDGEIPPWQLWKLLRRSGMRVVTLEHTPAGGMGTDWSVYKKIDAQIENVVEIYQGSRNSYEAAGAPQPAVARKGGAMSFGKYNAGVYQNALKQGFKLGVFASSDHRSTHISFGGVYVRKFDREGVFEAIDARRTIAATDKIFVEFSCNGRLLGEVFETTDKPALKISVRGTAPLRAVTIVRNETDLKRFAVKTSARFDETFTDDDPISGENRYYIRVEQTDGNMAWASPVWVTYEKK